MKKQTYERLRNFLCVDNIIHNYLLVIFTVFVGIILKLSLITSKEIIADIMFNAFVWAFMVIILAGIIIIIIDKVKGIFRLSVCIMTLMIILPIDFFQPIIPIIIAGIGSVSGFIFWGKEQSKKQQKQKRKNN